MGLDLLGLGSRHWPTKTSLRLAPKGWAIGCFLDAFGDAIPNLKRHLDTGNAPAARIHLHWAPHLPGYPKIIPMSDLRDKAPIIQKLAGEYRQIKFYVSHSCEYTEPDRRIVAQRVEMLKNLCPSCIPVNNPMKGGAVIEGVLTEHHGPVKVRPGEIVSTDGQNIYDYDAELYVNENKDAAITFLWGQLFNLRENTKPPQKPPPPKLRTEAPPPQYFNSIIRLAYPKDLGAIPPNAIKVARPELWKSHSEDSQEEPYEKPDSFRENRPIFISKIKMPSCEIVTTNGKRLGHLIYFGPFENGLHRYYAGSPGGIRLYGVEIGERAKKVSGSELIYLKFGTKKYGPINPAFRTGYFR